MYQFNEEDIDRLGPIALESVAFQKRANANRS